MELKLPISDKILLFVVAICAVGLGINYVYLMQRNWQGIYTIPLWIILLDIALVAGPMKDNKMVMYVVLLGASFFIEHQHLSATKGKEFDAVYFSFLILLMYGSALLFFSLLLFTRLDRISVDLVNGQQDLKGLQEEAKRLNKSIEQTQRGEGDNTAQVAAGTNFGLYRRAMSELFSVRSRKDVPGFLMRTLREGFGMDRAIVLEVPAQGDAVVKELWGDGLTRGAGMAKFQVPGGLVDMVREKSGAVLESELTGSGPHMEHVELMHSTGFEPIGMFPLMVRDPGASAGEERPSWVIVAVRPLAGKPAGFAEHGDGAEEEEEPVKSSLRILPIQSVLDIAGQFVSRANMK